MHTKPAWTGSSSTLCLPANKNKEKKKTMLIETCLFKGNETEINALSSRSHTHSHPYAHELTGPNATTTNIH